MNKNHRHLCPSPRWAAYVQGDVLPWLTEQANLGKDMLEIGPGPGAATEWLRDRVARLVALEVDRRAVTRLVKRYEGTNVQVVLGSAVEIAYPAESFDSVGCFTMLHHVPSVSQQQQIFEEVHRVLRPGAVFIGSDSLASNALHSFHARDAYNPVDPASLLVRLQIIGFERVTLDVAEGLRFLAYKHTLKGARRRRRAPGPRPTARTGLAE